MASLPAIALEGAKGVGKTETAKRRSETALNLSRRTELAAVSGDDGLLDRLPGPILVDEWQLHPPVWDQVKEAVDNGAEPGRFLLAGSARATGEVRIHSGAGRIVRLRLRPLAFSEREVCEPTVSLNQLLTGDHHAIEGTSSLTVPDYADEILASGFPGIRKLPLRTRNAQLDSYLDRIVDSELTRDSKKFRSPAMLKAWLSAYAAATSSQTSYNNLLDAATSGENDKPARQTTAVYREELLRMFILDPVEAWIPTFSPLRRLTQAPKHHLVDPALAARLVGVQREALLRGDGETLNASARTWLGALFESLVVQSVRTYAMGCDATVGHLRTKGGEREVDVIVESSDRTVVAFETKLSSTVNDSDVKHLLWLKETLGERLVDAAVLHTGPHAYRRSDGIAVIPFALLGP